MILRYYFEELRYQKVSMAVHSYDEESIALLLSLSLRAAGDSRAENRAGALEGVAQMRVGQLNGAPRRGRIADRVQHYEIVNGAKIPHGGHTHARLHHFISIGLAFITEDVILIRDNEGRRKPRKLIQRRLQGRGGGILPR